MVLLACVLRFNHFFYQISRLIASSIAAVVSQGFALAQDVQSGSDCGCRTNVGDVTVACLTLMYVILLIVHEKSFLFHSLSLSV